jgi:pyridoxamine 5'-phosphate oxidase family protein
MTLTQAERDYLGTQRLGRLATVGPGGDPQNNPVSFSYNAESGTIDIGGALTGQTPAGPHLSGEIIRIHPHRVFSWGIGPHAQGMARREVA